MNENKQALRQLVDDLKSFDPVAHMETETGRRMVQSDDQDMLAVLRLTGLRNSLLNDVFAKLGDTTFSMDWDPFVKLVLDAGFEQAYHEEFVPVPDAATDKTNPEITEHAYVWGHRALGLMLTADTYSYYSGDELLRHRNTAHLYYAWRRNEGDEGPSYGITSSGAWESGSEPNWRRTRTHEQGLPADTFWYGNHDCREGMIGIIQRLIEHGTLLPVWPNIGEPPAFALAFRNDWAELESMSFDVRTKALRQLERTRLAKMPDWFKAIVNGNYDE